MGSPERNGKPYLYVTWLCGLIAGDKHCAWVPWFKAHHRAEKRPDPTFNLAAWSAEHASFVLERAAELEAEGWKVTVEGANDFRWHGKTALVSGKPDIVGVRAGEVLVVDCKTGRQRHADYWQVLIYLMALPWVRPELRGLRIAGEVCYREVRVPIGPEALTDAAQDRIYNAIVQAAGDAMPARAPSRSECLRCDIHDDDCPDRFVDEQADPGDVAERF